MIKEKMLTASEVCVLVGCSIYTLNNWYTFKRSNPKNEYAKMLPDFIQSESRGPRYWKREDVKKLIEYKQSIPKGVNGVMGEVTQKYYNKEVKYGGNKKKDRRIRETKARRKSVKKED